MLLCSLGYLNSSIILQVFSFTISLHCNRKFIILFGKLNLKQRNTSTSSIYFKSIIHINKQTLKCVTIFNIKRIHNHFAISNNICHLLLYITPQSTKIFTLFQKFQMDFFEMVRDVSSFSIYQHLRANDTVNHRYKCYSML